MKVSSSKKKKEYYLSLTCLIIVRGFFVKSIHKISLHPSYMLGVMHGGILTFLWLHVDSWHSWWCWTTGETKSQASKVTEAPSNTGNVGRGETQEDDILLCVLWALQKGWENRSKNQESMCACKQQRRAWEASKLQEKFYAHMFEKEWGIFKHDRIKNTEDVEKNDPHYNLFKFSFLVSTCPHLDCLACSEHSYICMSKRV